jgi:hypothetical protein
MRGAARGGAQQPGRLFNSPATRPGLRDTGAGVVHVYEVVMYFSPALRWSAGLARERSLASRKPSVLRQHRGADIHDRLVRV